MHPGLHHWWKNRSRYTQECRTGWGCATEHEGGWAASGGSWGDPGGGAFGVRRPLRFLAHKLDLEETQVSELAKIIAELKTERAQAEVDERRSVSAFADAFVGDVFDEQKAREGAELRVRSAERLREAVVLALSRIHAVLDAKQRAHLGYLIRTGTLVI